MSKFNEIRAAVNAQLTKMVAFGNPMLQTVECKEELWDTYLKSFPEGLNPMYRERTTHDCNCCKAFIRQIGNIVTYDKNGKLVTIWDVQAGVYQPVVDAMATLVRSKAVDTIYLHEASAVGTEYNFDLNDGQKWEHFYVKLPSQLSRNKDQIPSILGAARNDYGVLKRSLDEITDEAIDMVLELIEANSLYRGAEFKGIVVKLKDLKTKINQSGALKETLLWKTSQELKGASAIRNTVIGTLLVDLSEGKDLEGAVAAFESKVAPQNYKRSSTLITQAMVKSAQEKIDELGLQESLPRRYAVTEDLTVNNVLFADRDAKNLMSGGIMDVLASSVKAATAKQTASTVEIEIAKFMSDVLPTAETMEVMMNNGQMGNLVSLIAPIHSNAPNMLKWNNNFSWSYAGEVTDSIRERVKAAGGKVDGDVRASLSWFNFDDLDLSIAEPSGNRVYFGNRGSKSADGGQLDVDENAGSGRTRTPVENIVYADRFKMRKGEYRVVVHNYAKRENIDVGFEVELDVLGTLFNIVYDKPVRDGERITVATIVSDGKGGITVKGNIPSTATSKDVWGIQTNQWVKVEMMMHSPNHWDGNDVGNKHYFFMLEGCKNPESSRGFYNEFLSSELKDHRKVFEVLGSKMRVEPSDNQLSGLGFSSTLRNELLVKVNNRTYMVKF